MRQTIGMPMGIRAGHAPGLCTRDGSGRVEPGRVGFAFFWRGSNPTRPDPRAGGVH
jgi:hypothetical protein